MRAYACICVTTHIKYYKYRKINLQDLPQELCTLYYNTFSRNVRTLTQVTSASRQIPLSNVAERLLYILGSHEGVVTAQFTHIESPRILIECFCLLN